MSQQISFIVRKFSSGNAVAILLIAACLLGALAVSTEAEAQSRKTRYGYSLGLSQAAYPTRYDSKSAACVAGFWESFPYQEAWEVKWLGTACQGKCIATTDIDFYTKCGAFSFYGYDITEWACEAGKFLVRNPAGSGYICLSTAVSPEKVQGPPCPNCKEVANPIHPQTGNKYQIETDYLGSGPFPLELRRIYNSDPGLVARSPSRWVHSYQGLIDYSPGNRFVESPTANVTRPDGRTLRFNLPIQGPPYDDPRGAWLSEADVTDKLAVNATVTPFVWSFSANIFGTVPGPTNCQNFATSLEAATCYATPSVCPGGLYPSSDQMAFDRVRYYCLDANSNVISWLEVTASRTVTIQSWMFTRAADEVVETFDGTGKLISRTNRAGLTQTLTYSTAATPPAIAAVPDLLIKVSDAFGKELNFTYDSNNRILTMTDPAGGITTYTYDNTVVGNPQTLLGNSKLLSVTYPDNKTRTYHYENATFKSALTGITDENNVRYVTWEYDAQGRAISSVYAGSVDTTTLVYNADGSSVVTDASGEARGYGFAVSHGVPRNNLVSGQPCAGCGNPQATFDANGFQSSRTDWNGNRTCLKNDSRGLATHRLEGITTACPADLTLNTVPAAAPARKITTQWHALWRLPVAVAEPLRITTYLYNGDAGIICGAPGALCSKTVQATADATGALGLSVTPLGTPRVWTYAYNAQGQVLTVDGPRTDVADITATAYYALDDADVGKRSNIASVTNALGQVTSITAYNGHGQPLTIVDPNGLTTTLSYDARLRLSSRTVAGETTGYTYDGLGQLSRVTLPDGSYLDYAYDAAHRLTQIADNLTNKIVYTLDARGNRIQEEVRDPVNALAQTRSRVYSSLNRLFQEIGAQAQTTEYSYDNQGNVAGVKDPLNRTTASLYDELNRLKQVTDPNTGLTQYAYNGIDQLVSVTDPRNLATSYNYDGLANLNQQVSPDTGTTANSFDAAGNLLTQTDAKGQVSTYAYDALNRVSSITFHDGSKHLYTYDQGANGIGRLTKIQELNPAQVETAKIDTAYDVKGRVLIETRTVGALAAVTAYTYDASGRLSAMTYPSGRSLAYGFDSLGRINQISTTAPASEGGQTQIVLQNVQYHPFGGVKSYTLGNGQIYARSIDLDGRIASYTLGNANFAIDFDAASRIRAISEQGNPSNANTYGYDSLDRLTQALLPNNSFGYSYDAVGNRLTKLIGAATESYTYGAASNRLDTLTPSSGSARTFQFDANGATTDDGQKQLAYDARGRLVQAVTTAGTTTYQVNALGQRIAKSDSAWQTIFIYDTRGKLIAETDPSGAAKREIIYLGDIPVGVLQ